MGLGLGVIDRCFFLYCVVPPLGYSLPAPIDPELAGDTLNSLWIWRTRIVADKESAIVPVKSRIANKVI
jgi:hypothetical protein